MSTGPDLDTPDSDLRKRAAWLLAMLAVVAVLIVVLFVTLGSGSGSGSGGQDAQGTIAEPTGSVPAAPTPPSSSSGAASRTSERSGSPSAAASGTASSASPTSVSTTSGASSGPVPTPSCSTSDTCNVTGDVAGAQQAIDAFRTAHQKPTVPVTQDPAAQRCARTRGSDCPQAFVWVRVDDLSGDSVVKAVSGYNGTDDLLGDKASSFGVGWAYDPGSKSVSCAVIRND